MIDGWATGDGPRRDLLSYLPVDGEDPEPAYAIADAWELPHPLALSADLCDRLVAAGATAGTGPRPNGEYRQIDLEPEDRQAILSRFREANARWWHLDLDRWDIHAKRYLPGDRHPGHQDLMAGTARRKLAGSVQLSEPGDYDGGALVMHHGPHHVAMPRTRGALVAFPGWTVHEVEVVTHGERWALIVNGWGPPLR